MAKVGPLSDSVLAHQLTDSLTGQGTVWKLSSFKEGKKPRKEWKEELADFLFLPDYTGRHTRSSQERNGVG